MGRFVQRLALAILFFSGAWRWAMESPSLAAEVEFVSQNGCIFEHFETRRRAPCAPSYANGAAQAVRFEPPVTPAGLSDWADGASSKVSLAAWESVLTVAYDEMELMPEPTAGRADLLPSPPLADTPFDRQAGSRSGDVEYQFGPAGGCRAHLSAADLLGCAPKPRPCRSALAVRFGWWGVSTQGVPTKVGEFQDLSSAPFWDVDHLFSNGVQTVDLYGTGLDNDGNQAGLYLFGPKATVGVDYQRYLRRLDHDPLTNLPPAGNIGGGEIVSEDLNVGADYAIRVQNLKTYIKGKLTRNLKYRVNFWLQRKQGDRQAISTQHCARSSAPGGGGGGECHVLSQTQQIDWLTTKVEPSVEARFGRLTIEYARPMRFFGQADQVVTRSFGDFHPYDFAGEHAYSVVPENHTQTDRLKVGVDLPLNSHFYGRLHTGNTRNRNRDTNRRFYGYDLRLTNRFWDRWTLTGFARMNRQSNQFPPFLVDPEGAATSDTTSNGQPLFSSIVPQYGLRRTINYARTSFGGEANWRPFRWTDLANGLAFNLGFERGRIERRFADYHIQEPALVVDQNHTPYTSYFVGTSMKWAPTFDTFVRYKGRTTENPLFGVNMYSGETNTRLSEQRNRVEFGGSWMPADNLIATANIGLENRRHNSAVANFDEDSYPLTFTLWYAPTTRWSFSAGYSHFSNWIDQDIYFPSATPDVEPYDRRTWNYGGTGQVVNLGGSYAWTPSVSLSGGVEFVSARNAIASFDPWPDLPQYFDVVVDRTRVTGGVDWWVRDGISAYFRYVFDDYQDLSVAYNSGSAHMVLAGFLALY